MTGEGAQPSLGRLAGLARKVLSDDPLIRWMSYQSALTAFGTGTFMTGSAVFFTKVVGLSVPQVGLGLTAGLAAQFLVSVPMGKLADRIGPRRSWMVGSFLQVAAFIGWFLVTGFWGFIAVTVAREVFSTLSGVGRGAYQLAVFPQGQRVRSQAYSRAALNVGFTFGALMSGIALATGSLEVIRAVPLLTAAVILTNSIMIARLPRLAAPSSAAAPGSLETQAVPEGDAEPSGGSSAAGGVVAPAVVEGHEGADTPGATAGQDGAGPVPGRPASRNVGFLLVMFLDGVLCTHQFLLETVIPLWLVADTNAPRVLLAWLLGTNTILAVLLQVRVARGVTDVRTALRAEYRSAACMVLSCVIILATDHTVIWLTIPLIWAAHVTVTGAELFESAGSWGLISELSDQRRLGDYQGFASLGNTLGTVWAPATYTYLATTWHAKGWLLIATIILVAAVAIQPATRLAERFLAAETAGAADAPVAAPPGLVGDPS